MLHEDLNLERITADRSAAIKESIHVVTIEELKALAERLFPYFDHPWREVYMEFLKQNAGSTFYRAKTHDRVEFIYCRAKENGMWFIQGNGMGPMQPGGLKILKKIVDHLG